MANGVLPSYFGFGFAPPFNSQAAIMGWLNITTACRGVIPPGGEEIEVCGG
jgi:hypothetical protein